jgi:hypothetical protein
MLKSVIIATTLLQVSGAKVLEGDRSTQAITQEMVELINVSI